MTFQEIVRYRRSVRIFKDEPLDAAKVKNCLELAVLSPNSSNMQLWEFYHVVKPEILKKLSLACFNQSAAGTAQQMVVFVTRQDLFMKRSKKMLELESQNVLKNSPTERQSKRVKTLGIVLWQSHAFFICPIFWTF
jgi:nitroreductase